MDILWKVTAFIVLLVFPKVFFTFSLIPFLLYAILCVVQQTFFNRYNWNTRDIFFIEIQFWLDAKVFVFSWNTIDCDFEDKGM